MLTLSRPVPGWPIALARTGVGLAVLLGALETHATLLGAADRRLQVPALAFLPAIEGWTAGVLLAVSAVAALLMIVPTPASRMGCLLATVSVWFAFVWEQQTYSNHLWLVSLLCLWMALSPSAGRARFRGPVDATLADQVLLMTQLSVCYFFAALVKFNPDFLSGDVLREKIQVELPSGAYPVLAVAAVATELFLAIGLWLRPTRVICAIAGAGLHLSILGLMGVTSAFVIFTVTCLSLYPLFLTRPSLLRPRLSQTDALEGRRVAAEPPV